MLPTSETRLDLLLTKRGLAPSRTEAQRLVEAGTVMVDGATIWKSNRKLSNDAELFVSADRTRYVSRGGEKLELALSQFKVEVAGAECLDIGISTGGFADCLLCHGAKRVVGVDVGHGQLHAKLVADTRVELREGVNARSIGPGDFDRAFDVIVIDVSFISLTKVLVPAKSVLAAGGSILALIKPQFEVGAGGLGKNGVVKDRTLRELARFNVLDYALRQRLLVIGTIDSPIRGGDGNIEYLTHLKAQ